MIAQVLNRQFVLEQLKAVQKEFQDTSSAELTKEFSSEELLDFSRLVETAKDAENQHSSGQPGYEVPVAERRDEQAVPLDDFAFFSRDPVICNFQSALEEYFEEDDDIEIIYEEDDDRRGGTIPLVTNARLADSHESRDESEEDESEARRVFDQFSQTDPRWVATLFAMCLRNSRGKHPFNYYAASPLQAHGNVRVVLLGDWGSGLPRAQRVADEVRNVLREGEDQGLEQHVIHLGDVYYSGWRREYEKRFLRYWPVDESEQSSIGSWCLNANHDMYSGGHGYFDYLLRDPRFEKQEGSSFFSISTDHWEVLGLDTAYDDHNLNPEQVEWVTKRLQKNPDRKVLLLSHHQLFSAYESDGPKLRQALEEVLASDRITAWFWGHEHRCVLYKPHMHVKYGRCVGHGGVPVYMLHGEDDPYPKPAIYEYRECMYESRGYIQGIEPWAIFGFAVLDFDGPTINVRYIDEFGNEHKTEVIS